MFLRQSRLFHEELFYTNTNTMPINVLYKSRVLAGPVQGLFAAYRIALSMVASGTRRRRLNNPGPAWYTRMQARNYLKY